MESDIRHEGADSTSRISELGAILDLLPDAVVLIDDAGLCELANLAAGELLGTDVRELSGRTLLATIVVEDRDRFRHALAGVGVEPVSLKVRLSPQSRSMIHGELIARRISPQRILLTLRDMTAHSLAQERLRRTEERYRLIVEHQKEFVVRWRPDGTRLFVNDSYCRAFGVREEDCLGTSFLPLIAPEHRSNIETLVAALTPEVPEFTEEHLSFLPHGPRWQEWTTRGTFDQEGQLRYLVSTGHDVTERKLAEERLRHSERHLQTSQRAAGIGSWEWPFAPDGDPATGDRYWSDECFRIFGYAPKSGPATGAQYRSRIHPGDWARVAEAQRRAVATGSEYAIYYRILLDDDVQRSVHERAAVIADAETGAPLALAGTLQDVTAREQLARQVSQSQRMQALGQLAGGIAHDFNNLLTIIRSHGDLLSDATGLSDEDRGSITAIEDATRRASQLTTQLLLFTRKSTAHAEVLDPTPVVRDAGKLLGRLMPENIALSVDSARDLRKVKIDRSQLEQIVVNLALNARDAISGRGSIQIALTNETPVQPLHESRAAVDMDFVRLRIMDTGKGMSTEVREHLFEPFFTTKRPGKGIGLGLSTVDSILRESGGFVTVDSSPGRGSIFDVFLPAVEHSPYVPAPPPSETDHLRGHETVMIADDDVAIVTLAKRSLERLGYSVLTASDGATALRLGQQHAHVDVLVTDVMMEDMNGVELSRQMLTELPRCRIVYMSGYGEEDLPPRRPEDSFIQKPFRPNELLAVIRHTLDARPADEAEVEKPSRS